jgi:O-antigen/teichoic acid export membrane protein
MSLLQKVLRGSFLNLMDQGVRVVAMLLVTPVVVSHLGLERYGIWLLVMAAISFLALLDGGVTLSGTRFLARSIGGTGSQEEIIGTLRWLYWRIGLACLVGTLGLALAVPWLVQDQQWQETARWALLALGGSMAVRFFLRIHLVVLKAHLRYDLIVTASLVKVVLQSVLVVVLLVRGHGLVVLALAQILSDLVDQFLVVMFSKRTESSLPAARHSPVLLPEILRYSGIAFLQTMGQHLRSQADPFILSAFVGVSSVPVYNMAMRLVSLFDDMVNAALGGTLLSAFSHVEGRSGMAGLKVQYLFSLRFSVILTLLGGAGLFVLGPAFLVAWLGEGFSESGFLLRLILIPAMFKLMQYPGYGLLYSINQHYQLTKLTFAGGLINAVLSIALTSQIGIQGVALATFIEMSLFYIVILPVIISSTISMPLITYYRELLKPAVKLAIPLVLWGVCIHPYVQPDFLRLALAGSSLIPVVALGSLFLLFSRQERGELYLRLRRAPSAAEPAAPLK